MSNEPQPQSPADQPHQEKQTMTEPQEEFIGDAPASRDVSEVPEEDRPARPPAEGSR